MPKRKKKIKFPKVFVVPERKQKPMKTIDKVAWEIARVMTKQRPDKNLVNKKVLCPTCNKRFCLGFDGVEQYCKDCFYFPCEKELTGERVCKNCSHIDWWGVYIKEE